MTAPAPAGEADRAEYLRQYQILDTPPEPGFDDLAFLAAQLCRVPIASIGFLDAERLWLKARIGLRIQVIPRQHAFLTTIPPVSAALVVPDLLADSRYAHHPLVSYGPKVRFYAGVPLVLEGHLVGALEVMDHVARTLAAEQVQGLQALARQTLALLELRRAIPARQALLLDMQRANVDLGAAYDATLESLARTLDLRDGEVEGHLERVAGITVRLAQALGVPDAGLVHIHRGALLHDIGKMPIPDSILLKPGALSDEEWAIMRRHPLNAFEMLSPIALLRPALDIPYSHHERWDGEGYPRQLKGEAIPLAARIFSVVDVWDALRSDRPYRKGWADDRVRDYIRKRAGADFDPTVVAAFLRLEL